MSTCILRPILASLAFTNERPSPPGHGNELLGGKGPESFSKRELSLRAFYRAKRNQPLEAALLSLATVYYLEAQQGELPLLSHFESFARAACHWAEAGRWERAEPLLRRVLEEPEFWEPHADGSYEQSWCATHVIHRLAEQGQRSDIEQLVADLTARFRASGNNIDFPPWESSQLEIAQAAHRAGALVARDAMLALLEASIRRPKKIMTEFEAFKAEIAQATPGA